MFDKVAQHVPHFCTGLYYPETLDETWAGRNELVRNWARSTCCLTGLPPWLQSWFEDPGPVGKHDSMVSRIVV